MAKETIIMTGKIIGIIAGLIVTLITCGMAIGYIKSDVDNTGKKVIAIVEKQQIQQNSISRLEREQAYQKGVVNTKLDNLEKGQTAIMQIIQEWEPQ